MPMRLYSAKRSRATTWISHFGCAPARVSRPPVTPAMPLPTITTRSIDCVASHDGSGCAAAVAASGVSATDDRPAHARAAGHARVGSVPESRRASPARRRRPARGCPSPSTTAIGSAPQMPIRQPDSSASPQRSASSSTVASRSAPTRCPAGRKVTSIAARPRSAAQRGRGARAELHALRRAVLERPAHEAPLGGERAPQPPQAERTEQAAHEPHRPFRLGAAGEPLHRVREQRHRMPVVRVERGDPEHRRELARRRLEERLEHREQRAGSRRHTTRTADTSRRGLIAGGSGTLKYANTNPGKIAAKNRRYPT